MRAARLRRGNSNGLDAWPGYVDALSTLLMVIIFVLLVFVLAQAFLSVALSGRDQALERLNRQVAQLTDMLSLERGRSRETQLSLAGINQDLAAASASRDDLARQLDAARQEASRAAAERDAMASERDRLAASLQDARAETGSAGARVAQLQAQLADTGAKLDEASRRAATLAGQYADTSRQARAADATIADTRRQLDAANASLAAMRGQMDANNAKLSDALKQIDAEHAAAGATAAQLTAARAERDRLADQVHALEALRDALAGQVRDATDRADAAALAAVATSRQLADEQRQSDGARAQIALLSKQLDDLRARMEQAAAALDLAEAQGRDKDAQIVNLGTRLNAALASKVEELQRYRSEFFGRLRTVLANRPGIQVVGDRFVFQSEVLFPVGSADLSSAGTDQITALAETLKQIAADIPADLHWILRVDGHADRQPVGTSGFVSNWELSSQRAVNVVKRLIEAGIAPEHLAATGFAEFQPIDPADTVAAYTKNRRIELRLTDR